MGFGFALVDVRQGALIQEGCRLCSVPAERVKTRHFTL
jgi:hypothetical protein